jgi:phage terminase large subunit GpA-like protein
MTSRTSCIPSRRGRRCSMRGTSSAAGSGRRRRRSFSRRRRSPYRSGPTVPRLPSTSAEPGQWRTSRAPYLKRIMDVLGSERAREVVFAKSSQVGGSSCAENLVGYLMDQAPCAILEVWPTEKMLKAWSLTRLDADDRGDAGARAKFPKSGRRDSSDSIAYKAFLGGWIQGLTAKSTSDLRAHSARVAVAEEVDEWEADLKGQGDPLELLRTRMRTFWNGLLFIISTPTLQGYSRVWRELESSTWEEYFVPCPHCGHMQTLRWRDGDEDPDAAGVYRLTGTRRRRARRSKARCSTSARVRCAIDERTRRPWSPPASGARATRGARRSASTSTRCTRSSARGSTWCARSSAGGRIPRR